MLSEELTLLTEKEAAALLRLNVKTLQNRRYYRKPPTYIKRDRSVLYRLSDLRAYIRSCEIFPGSDRC